MSVDYGELIDVRSTAVLVKPAKTSKSKAFKLSAARDCPKANAHVQAPWPKIPQ